VNCPKYCGGDELLGADLITYLSANGFSVSPVANFIPADTPDSKLPALYIMGSGGFAPHDYVPTERPTFQIIVKGKSFKTAAANMAATEAEAKRLIKYLNRRVNYYIAGELIFSSKAMQSNPIYLGADELNRPMYSTNFVFYLREV
jgi:hypothetical protein